MSEFVDRWAQFWAAPSIEGIDVLSAPDIVLRYPGVAEPFVGLDQWRGRVASILERFPDVTMTVTHHATGGQLCFIAWHATATAADGKPLEWEGIDRMILRDGVVADSMVAFDTAGLRR